MKLATHRFLKGQFNFRRTADSPIESVPLYSYETTGKNGKLFDLMVLNGQELVRTNMGQWSNLITAWNPIHYEIRHHFLEHCE